MSSLCAVQFCRVTARQELDTESWREEQNLGGAHHLVHREDDMLEIPALLTFAVGWYFERDG